MRNHSVADDLKPAERAAVIARDARIDAREAIAVDDGNAAQDWGVTDDEPLCTVSGKHRAELLVRGGTGCRRQDWGAFGFRVGIARHEAAVPERAQRIVE